MGIHIAAKNGDIAETVLLPGDPLRAQHIAQTFLGNVSQYTEIRNMYGFTGTAPDGRRVTVQGAGIGIPSLSIYVNELVQCGAKRIIRVGTCGSLQVNIKVGDIVLAQGACTDSGINRRRFKGMDFAPLATWELLRRADATARGLRIPVQVGNVLATDLFYNDIDPDEWKLWADANVLAIEMETSELYTLAARKGFQALTILMMSDVLPTGASLPPEEREKASEALIKIALAI